MKKKSLKKKIVIALAGIILAGSMGWSRIPAQAAVNGTICSHRNSQYLKSYDTYDSRGYQGHLVINNIEWHCNDCNNDFTDSFYGPLETHNFTIHDMIEDLHNGLYWHWIQCDKCGYEDEVLSGDPDDPQV